MGEGMMIHPTAVVDPKAAVGEGVEIGPYSVIGPHVVIGKGTRVSAHVVITGRTTLGEENRIFPFASIGSPPQDMKYKGEESQLVIGDRNIIREFASLNPGTGHGGMVTQVGSDNLFMNYSHVAHDCRIGSHVVLANGVALAGHVGIEDHVIVGGLVAIHQYVCIGEVAILGGGSMVSMDVPPYCMVAGDRARLRGLNLVGLRRQHFSEAEIARLKQAYRILFRQGLRTEAAIERVNQELPAIRTIGHLIEFIRRSRRGICR
jgi:UDP-N-acetylglucosamine acyltransferase